jgi:hypothetical protein
LLWRRHLVAATASAHVLRRGGAAAKSLYLKRAIVTQLGLGANVPEDAIYPINLGDDTGTSHAIVRREVAHFAWSR